MGDLTRQHGPRTKAGRRLAEDIGFHAFLDGSHIEDRILAIEVEAAALAAEPEPGRRIFVPEGSRDSGEVDRITAKGQYPQEPAAKPEPVCNCGGWIGHADDCPLVLAAVIADDEALAANPEPGLDAALVAELMALLGPSHPHDEGRGCGTCKAYLLLARLPAKPPCERCGRPEVGHDPSTGECPIGGGYTYLDARLTPDEGAEG